MERFIDPKILARVKDLPLVAKAVAEGFLHGLQSSMQRGVGIEFSQYRAYETGDELSRVDWKLFARSDRYFVREAERESEIDIWFLLDSSASMGQRSEHQTKSNEPLATSTKCLNKLDYAKILIATLAYIAQKQGDSVGLLNLNGEQVDLLSTGNGLKHWQKLLLKLENIQSEAMFPSLEQVATHIQKMVKPSIIFFISDFSQREAEISNLLTKLNSSRSEVVAMQLYCDDEINFNYNGAIRFKDLETNEELLVSAGRAESSYQTIRQNYLKELNTELREKNIYSANFNIDEPLDAALFEYLTQRQRVM